MTNHDLCTIGVIGTSGKSSVVYCLANSLENAVYICDTHLYLKKEIIKEYVNTTPAIKEIQQALQLAKDNNCTYFVMEISSHAIKQERIKGIQFDYLLYTNFSLDHLDYHQSIMEYLHTKLLGYHYLKENGKIYVYQQELYELLVELTTNVFKVKEDKWEGAFPFENENYSLVKACLDDLDKEIIIEKIKGRMQCVYDKECTIYIDYAHTLGAYETIGKCFENEQRKKIIVFGLGGNRDTNKRKNIGEMVGKYFDEIIVTSDNIRNENPFHICFEIMQSMHHMSYCIIDREKAIQKAIAIGRNGGIIIIAGKGNESYQEISGKKYAYRDDICVMKIVGV